MIPDNVIILVSITIKKSYKVIKDALLTVQFFTERHQLQEKINCLKEINSDRITYIYNFVKQIKVFENH